MLSRDAFHRARAQLHFARGDGARARRHLAKCGFGGTLEDVFGRVLWAEQSFVDELMPRSVTQPEYTNPPKNEMPAEVRELFERSNSPFVVYSPRSPLLPDPRDNKCCMGPNVWARASSWSNKLEREMRNYAALHWREVLHHVVLKLNALPDPYQHTYADDRALLRRIESAAAQADTEGHDTTADTWGIGVALFHHTHPSFSKPHAQAKLCIKDPQQLVTALTRYYPPDAYDYTTALENYVGLTSQMLLGMQGITDRDSGKGYILIS